ncbi:MAG: ATP-binding cassette domain-containing protein [Lactimicrobium massiliense]|nr:ATP-binding cassette domain-containing protein [Lactimicrobium massiliense]MDD6675046.1 ATP-binding cassette domain-containing protein [Lactimicrobium massiliense]
MLEIEHVSKTFAPGTVNEKKALVDVSLKINDGDFVTVLGSNGAGKSTLFQAISGTYRIDSGKIVLDGKNIAYVPEYKRAKYIGRLFQDPLKGTAPHMTIEENLALAYLRAGTHTNPLSRISRADRERFRDALKKLDMGLEDRMDVPVGTLSGGQRQALTLLMATIVPPKLLLLDEHTAALDPSAAEKIMALTEAIVKENGTTCLMVTHNMHQALTSGNRILMMKDGRIVSDIQDKTGLSVEDLLAKFHQDAGEDLDNDRILLS